MTYFEPNYSTKMRNTDRVIILEPKEGSNTLDSKGMVDNRLFTGENKLHAVMDPINCQWSLKYDSGVIPRPLSGKWTSFSKMVEHLTQYFNRRNINIKQIID
jgi:hypothetical protein